MKWMNSRKKEGAQGSLPEQPGTSNQVEMHIITRDCSVSRALLRQWKIYDRAPSLPLDTDWGRSHATRHGSLFARVHGLWHELVSY